MPMTAAKTAGDEILNVEEREAWWKYLSTTQGVLEPRYSELEPWAWNRLQQQLRAIRARRRAAGRSRGLAA